MGWSDVRAEVSRERAEPGSEEGVQGPAGHCCGPSQPPIWRSEGTNSSAPWLSQRPGHSGHGDPPGCRTPRLAPPLGPRPPAAPPRSGPRPRPPRRPEPLPACPPLTAVRSGSRSRIPAGRAPSPAAQSCRRRRLSPPAAQLRAAPASHLPSGRRCHGNRARALCACPARAAPGSTPTAGAFLRECRGPGAEPSGEGRGHAGPGRGPEGGAGPTGVGKRRRLTGRGGVWVEGGA